MSARDSHTERQWQGKFFRCQMQCYYCRIPLVLGGNGPELATKDHLTPLTRGGSDAISNIVPACIDCNRLKGDMTEEEFRTARQKFARSAFSNSNTVPCSLQTLEQEHNLALKREAASIRHRQYLQAKAEREKAAWWRA